MQADSDDEIFHLRNAALLTKSTNMRKRKVTLTNTRKIISRDVRGDRREVVQGRQIVIEAKSPAEESTDSSNQNKLCGISLDSNTQSDSIDTGKKLRLESDQRIFNAVEEKTTYSVNKEKSMESEMSTLPGNDFKDVRIVLSKNGLMESEIPKEMNMEIVDDNIESYSLEHVELVGPEKIEIDGMEGEKHDDSEIGSSDDAEETNDIVDEKKDNFKETDVVNDKTIIKSNEEETENDPNEGNESVDEKKEKETVKPEKLDNVKKTIITHKSEGTNSVTEKCSNDTAESKVEAGKKGDNVSNEEKRPNISKKTTKKNGDETKNVKSVSTDGSNEDNDSGSDSDSSYSSSSSGSSSSSSSSSGDSSSDSQDSSDSNSSTDSAEEKKSIGKSRSRSVSVSSSSYSYSTSGSAEKKDTLRSVVAQTNQSSKHPRGRISRSPRSRSRSRSRSRNRQHTRRRRSNERDNRYNLRDDRGYRRDEGSRHSRWRAREDPSSPFQRRGSRETSRDRERTRFLGARYDRTYGQLGRRHQRSRSPVKYDRQSSDQMDPDNPLSRKDDDYVDIDVGGKNAPKSTKTNKGFDLRAKLGSKKSDEQSSKIEEEKPGKSVARRLIIRQEESKDTKSDKELKLDARIERIRVMNEEIKRRNEEIEREKLLYD